MQFKKALRLPLPQIRKMAIENDAACLRYFYPYIKWQEKFLSIVVKPVKNSVKKAPLALASSCKLVLKVANVPEVCVMQPNNWKTSQDTKVRDKVDLRNEKQTLQTKLVLLPAARISLAMLIKRSNY